MGPKASRNILASSALLVLVVLVFAAFFRGPRFNPVEKMYFIDEETGQESIAPATELPPLPGASGKPTRVRAICYTLDGGKTHAPAFYEKFSNPAKVLVQTAGQAPVTPENEEILRTGHLVRSPAPDSKWVPIDSETGRQITSEYHTTHGDAAVLYYPP